MASSEDPPPHMRSPPHFSAPSPRAAPQASGVLALELSPKPKAGRRLGKSLLSGGRGQVPLPLPLDRPVQLHGGLGVFDRGVAAAAHLRGRDRQVRAVAWQSPQALASLPSRGPPPLLQGARPARGPCAEKRWPPRPLPNSPGVLLSGAAVEPRGWGLPGSASPQSVPGCPCAGAAW